MISFARNLMHSMPLWKYLGKIIKRSYINLNVGTKVLQLVIELVTIET